MKAIGAREPGTKRGTMTPSDRPRASTLQIHGIKRSAKGYKTITGAMYFVANGKGRAAHLPPGIYKKTGTHGVSVVPLILFVRKPSYKVRFPFDAIVHKSIEQNFRHCFEDRIQKAIATAKK